MLDSGFLHKVLGSPVRSRELDSMILTSPFQPEIFKDSMLHDLFCKDHMYPYNFDNVLTPR